MKPGIAAISILLLGSSVSAVGQSVHGRALIHVGEVLSLRILPGGGVLLTSADGTYREMEGAVRLEVTANRRWRLTVRSAGEEALAGAKSAGASSPAVWWRVGKAAGAVEVASEGFQRVEAWPTLVAEGGAGERLTIDVDCRWWNEPGRERDPGGTLDFTLSPS